MEEADRRAVAGLPEELRRVLLLEEPGHDEFVTRFQQTSGPVMAKGVEDTALYRYVRLLALNEVGGDPGRFSLGVDGFHAANCGARSASRTRSLREPRTTRSAAPTCEPGSAQSPASPCGGASTF